MRGATPPADKVTMGFAPGPVGTAPILARDGICSSPPVDAATWRNGRPLFVRHQKLHSSFLGQRQFDLLEL